MSEKPRLFINGKEYQYDTTVDPRRKFVLLNLTRWERFMQWLGLGKPRGHDKVVMVYESSVLRAARAAEDAEIEKQRAALDALLTAKATEQ